MIDPAKVLGAVAKQDVINEPHSFAARDTTHGSVSMAASSILFLTRAELSNLLDFEEHVRAVEQAFRLHAGQQTLRASLLHVDAPDGEFHIKAGGLELERLYFALKVNGGFFENQRRYGLPNIQGVIVLFDGSTGTPLAVMDSADITLKRTGAATAVAARHLARPDTRTATVCGCGRQGRIQLVALKHALPLEQAYVFDSNWEAACRCAKEMSEVLQFPVIPVRDLAAAVRRSEVCVTCTPSRAAVLHAGELPAGIFVSAVGADSPDKQELDPALLAASTVVVDVLEQCAAAGELHHAVAAGLMHPSDVYAELGEIVAGVKPGRRDPGETIIFDATGTALQDVASAAAAYRKAVEHNVGTWLALAE